MEIAVQTLKLFLDVNQIMIFMDMVISYAEDTDNGICLFPYVKVNLDTETRLICQCKNHDVDK